MEEGGILVHAKKALQCYEIDSPSDIVQVASLQFPAIYQIYAIK